MDGRVSRTIELVLSLIPVIKDQAVKQRLSNQLQQRLTERYRNCWYEKEPLRGSARRCITLFQGNLDQDFLECFEAEGLKGHLDTVIQNLGEVAIWVDPDGVFCRANDRGVPQPYAPGKPPPMTPRGTSAIPIVPPKSKSSNK